MGLISGLLGNASEVDAAAVMKSHEKIFVPGETVESAFKLVRDLIVFTNKRLILIDFQGITGKKIEYFCVPYKSVKYFSLETAGHFDLDGELKIWLSSKDEPTITRQLKKGVDIAAIQRTLAYFVLQE